MNDEVTSGRDPKTGHFCKGNRIGKGENPFAAELQKFRSAIFCAVREEDVEDVLQAVLDKAKSGDIKAAVLLLEVTGLRVRQIEANVTTQDVTPEEAHGCIAEFFGINQMPRDDMERRSL